MAKKIGILTAGSDCPGLNAAIRAIGKSARGAYGMEVIGFQDGFQGLIHDQTIDLEGGVLSNIITAGGTILGTSRDKPYEVTADNQIVDRSDAAMATYQRHHLDCLVCLGGRETQESAYRLMQKGLNIITLPKAIDNDVAGTDVTVGFDTALTVASEAIDRLHSTAHSHHRIIIVELMGQYSGWLTLGAGMAGGADVIIIPEIPYDTQKVADAILERNRAGKRFSIIAISEGALTKENVSFFKHSRKVNQMLRTGTERDMVDARLTRIEDRFTGNTMLLANQLEKHTGLDTRITILGYLLRGGTPSAEDRILATQLGSACVDLVQAGQYGVMVGINGRTTRAVALEEVAGKHKQVPLDHAWITSARHVGTHLGE